jgi:predicted deacylase
VGVLEGEVQTRASLGLPDAVILDGRDATNYVIAEEEGLWEGMKEPGERVSSGEPVGRLWFPDRLDRAPEPMLAPRDGVVSSIRAIPVTEAGDSVFTIGQPIAKEALL